jgi:hypothetical protein
MNQDQFRILFNNVIDQCKEIAVKKAVEYAPNEDRLESFYSGNAYGVNAYQNCMTHMAKHITAIETHVKTSSEECTHKFELNESFNDRLKDLIIYCILMIAIHSENTSEL